ncbi:hypothetical protein WR25_19488 isoform B [Diploscapter pachys]|uniref:Uncharacterized protein n=1 Tax=Diploscapter pachys TaxID=2018661 RepID=A0A2A2K0H2_9BILA|nr:hypothetical protein WR25_19488 isoform B [Diploscapter pachys]
MNTMFACPGFCGGAYKHGDEAHPYPEGATTIAERRPQHRPKAGSASLPNSPPSSPKSRPSGGPAARAPSFDARKSARTPPKLHINRAVKKLAESSSRNSEPHIGRNHDDRINSGAKSKKEKKGKKSSTTSGASFGQNSREWDKDLELMRPPGLDRHCPSETLKGIYGEKEPPRMKIEKMLKEAHTGGLIEDVYNQRRLSVPHEGEPVPAAPIGRPNADGPNMLIRQPDEHVQIYSILEIDRAFKNPSLDPGLKLIVVTRCVSADNMADKRLADTFLKVTHQKQEEKDKNNQAKVAARKSKIQVSSEPIEIGNTWNTSATCIGSQGGCSPAPISGGAIPSTLSDEAYRNDPRSNDPYMCRFFHRQREDSLSAYPNNSYRCPFQYPENAASGNGHASPVDADLNRFCSHPTSPMADDEIVFSCGDPSGNCNQLTNHSGRLAASFTADWSSIGVPTSRSELSELDIEVRSYHPDDTNWNHSESSRSSSSSDGCAAPTSTSSALPAPVAPSSSPGSSSSLPPMGGSVGSVSPSPRNAQAPPPQFASRA